MNEPFASLVVAALEEKAQDVKGQITQLQQAILRNDAQGEPDLKAEHKYLLGHFNAYNKALFYWNKGIRPEQAPNGDWLIPSGSQAGAQIHRVTRAGGVWQCGPTCKAQTFHWHGAILDALDRAWELAELHDDAADLAVRDDYLLYQPAVEIDPEPFLPGAADLGRRLAQARAQAAMNELFA